MNIIEAILGKFKTEAIKKLLENIVDKTKYSFGNCDELPKEKGIYFIKDVTGRIIYIGCAHKDKRTIRVRCKQYVGASNTGGNSFRKKVFERILKKPKNVRLKNSKKHEYVIEQLKSDNYFINCLILTNKSSKEILLLERIFIYVFNPVLND